MTDRVEALVLRARAPATRAARAADTAARILLEIADMVLESGWGWWRAGSWLWGLVLRGMFRLSLIALAAKLLSELRFLQRRGDLAHHDCAH